MLTGTILLVVITVASACSSKEPEPTLTEPAFTATVSDYMRRVDAKVMACCKTAKWMRPDWEYICSFERLAEVKRIYFPALSVHSEGDGIQGPVKIPRKRDYESNRLNAAFIACMANKQSVVPCCLSGNVPVECMPSCVGNPEEQNDDLGDIPAHCRSGRVFEAIVICYYRAHN